MNEQQLITTFRSTLFIYSFMDLIIRAEQKKDFEHIKKVNNIAFGQENEGKLVEALRNTSKYMPSLSLVAEINNEIVGHILFYPVPIENDSGNIIVLSLAPMAVHPDHQNKGIGSKLITRGLNICKETDFGMIIVLGHPNYYPRFGFKTASSLDIHLPFNAPDEAFMALPLKENNIDKYAGIVKFPKEYFDAL